MHSDFITVHASLYPANFSCDEESSLSSLFNLAKLFLPLPKINKAF